MISYCTNCSTFVEYPKRHRLCPTCVEKAMNGDVRLMRQIIDIQEQALNTSSGIILFLGLVIAGLFCYIARL